ncbi:helix-turn-helix transcriptional regulator [Pseudomonas sp. SH1-B]
MGRRHQVHYSLLGTPHDENPCVMQGYINEQETSLGMTLVTSRVQTFQSYQAQSCTSPNLTMVVLQEGQAQLAGSTSITLTPGQGVILLSQDRPSQTARHHAHDNLHGLNLSIGSIEDLADDYLADQLQSNLQRRSTYTELWSVPANLQQELRALACEQSQGCLQRLLSEGLALQLLAHGLNAIGKDERNGPSLNPRDRSLLKRVRDYLHQEPGADHSLNELAQLACMSPSALRHKFQHAYGLSVMGYLRQRRMELARHYLAQGWRVQDAAHYVGYRHASNFATAYRQHFGVSPRKLT